MKYFYIPVLFILSLHVSSEAAIDTVFNSGFTFSPSTITVQAGDTIMFALANIHTAREVTQTTWNANGTTSNGGFDLPGGGGTVVLTLPGTYYYVCVNHASLGMKGIITVEPLTSVPNATRGIPKGFMLWQNYPNPFNPSTTIRYSLPMESWVRLTIYNVNGDIVARLVDRNEPAGEYEMAWSAYNYASGVYLYTFEAFERLSPTISYRTVGKMILLK